MLPPSSLIPNISHVQPSSHLPSAQLRSNLGRSLDISPLTGVQNVDTIISLESDCAQGYDPHLLYNNNKNNNNNNNNDNNNINVNVAPSSFSPSKLLFPLSKSSIPPFFPSRSKFPVSFVRHCFIINFLDFRNHVFQHSPSLSGFGEGLSGRGFFSFLVLVCLCLLLLPLSLPLLFVFLFLHLLPAPPVPVL